MPDPTVAIASIAAAWKLVASLYAKFEAWDQRRTATKVTRLKMARAEELMKAISMAILSGASGDDPQLAPLVNEFRALVGDGVAIRGADLTEEWIDSSQKQHAKKAASAKKVVTKRVRSSIDATRV